MKLYVYCPRPSTSAFDLLKTLGASRLRKFDGMDFWNKNKRVKLEADSVIICWGATIPEFEGARVINSLDNPLNKYQEWTKLVNANVPTISMMPRAGEGGYAPANMRKMGYLPRVYQHQGGTDLLNPNTNPDFWVQKEEFTHEYRIHSFSERSIRAGVKVGREGFVQSTEADWKPNSNLIHPWIRSYDAGWRINYDNFKSTKAQRAIAHMAVKALGLTFGAVDIAQTKGGELKVLEVNTAPGSDPNTTAAYVRAITSLLEQPAQADAAPEGLPAVKVVAPDPPPPFIAPAPGPKPDWYEQAIAQMIRPKPAQPANAVPPPALVFQRVYVPHPAQIVYHAQGDELMNNNWRIQPLNPPPPPQVAFPGPEPIFDEDPELDFEDDDEDEDGGW